MASKKDTKAKVKKPAAKKGERVYITRAQIISVKDIKEEDVHVPEWAEDDQDPDTCFVKVVGMDGNRRDVYNSMVQNARKKTEIDLGGLTTKFVIGVVVDPETREPLFNESDLAVLQAKSSEPMDRIMIVGQRISGMGQESIKEIVENLGLTPKDDTGSSLPKN